MSYVCVLRQAADELPLSGSMKLSESEYKCLTSEKKSERMIRLIQWIMLANWNALETGERRTKRNNQMSHQNDAESSAAPIGLCPHSTSSMPTPLFGTDRRHRSRLQQILRDLPSLQRDSGIFRAKCWQEIDGGACLLPLTSNMVPHYL